VGTTSTRSCVLASHRRATLAATGAMAFKIDADGRFSVSWFLDDDQSA
jgi:hypothetical protein